MLIEFNVANFRSFWEEQSLKMTANTKPELKETNTFNSGVKGIPRLMRSACIYGPNASGKSNLVLAMKFMQNFVLSSAKESQEGERIDLKPFLFNKMGLSVPSVFEVHFVQDGVRYQYGFSATNERVYDEWLMAYPEGKAQRWFERTYDPEKEEEKWYFGGKFLGSKIVWQNATRKNALFLSTAIQLNNDQLKPVFSWFKRLLVVEHGALLHPGFSIERCEDEKGKEEILAFMNAADLSIEDIKFETKMFSSEDLPDDFPPEMKEQLEKDLKGEKLYRVKFLHPVHDSKELVPLPLEDESDGTRKLFAYAGPWIDLLRNGRVLFVDELDNSLHPKIVRFLLKLLHSAEKNNTNGQVVFTSHDTSTLDQKQLRRDQIWFVEKDDQNATNLYPLSDFSPRKGEALQKGYLRGRYGAVPYISETR